MQRFEKAAREKQNEKKKENRTVKGEEIDRHLEKHGKERSRDLAVVDKKRFTKREGEKMENMMKTEKGGRVAGRTNGASVKSNKGLFLYHPFCSHTKLSPAAVVFVMSEGENNLSSLGLRFGCLTATLMQWFDIITLSCQLVFTVACFCCSLLWNEWLMHSLR